MRKKNKILFTSNSYNKIREIIKRNKNKIIFSFMNANDVYEFKKREIVRSSIDTKFPRIISVDGTTLSLVLSLKNFKKIKRLQGPTFTNRFLNDEEMMREKKHFFFGISNDGISKICEKYPVLERKNLHGIPHPFINGYSFSKKLKNEVISTVNKNRIDYLWVGAGCPRQEIFANEVFEKVKVSNIFNVGVALKYIQGEQKRAPRFFQKIGLEWLYRFFTDFKLTSKRIWPCIKGTFQSFTVAKLVKE